MFGISHLGLYMLAMLVGVLLIVLIERKPLLSCIVSIVFNLLLLVVMCGGIFAFYWLGFTNSGIDELTEMHNLCIFSCLSLFFGIYGALLVRDEIRGYKSIKH